jgi:hypothetical protein
LCEQTAARRRPDSQKKGLLRSDDATGQQKKVCCAATEKAAQKKISACRALERGCGKKKKILHGALTRLFGCDRIKKISGAGADKAMQKRLVKKIAARAVKTDQTATGQVTARLTLLSGSKRTPKKNNLRALQSGSDRSKRKRFCAPCRVDATGPKKIYFARLTLLLGCDQTAPK